MTLEDYLSLHARQTPDAIAASYGGRAMTYSELDNAVTAKAERLNAADAPRAILLRAVPGLVYLVSYLATHRSGRVAVPLEADIPQERADEIEKTVNNANIPDGTADILFTTGTTGRQKGVMVSHRAIIADAENLISGQHFHRNLTFVISGPMNHIGSLSKLWPVLLTGGTLRITDGMKNMAALFDEMQQAEAPIATFLVPASIHLMMNIGGKQLKALADKIEFIETGAAPITEADMHQLHELLPKSRLYNTYASTETGIISTYDYANNPIVAGCLGLPLPHSKIIIEENDYEATGTGRLICSGDTLMTGYVGDETKTREILHDGALHTNDCGRLDAMGQLHLAGRNDDTINVGGYKVAPEEVEDAAMSFPGIDDCICRPANNPIIGTIVELCIVPKAGAKVDKRALAHFLRQKLERYKVPQAISEIERVPRNQNGKIVRKAELGVGPLNGST